MIGEKKFKIGSIVTGLEDKGKLMRGKIYVVFDVDKHDKQNIYRIRGEGMRDGWWVYEKDIIRVNKDAKDCKFCKSMCKKDDVCAFFKGVWEDVMVEE